MSNKNQIAVQEKNIVDNVINRVREFENTGQLTFPQDYLPENALRAAYLTLQETTTRDRKPVLQACSTASIANSLLSMVVQGLNVDRDQGYFLAYGKRLVFQRSYFGNMALAKRLNPDIEDIYGMTIYKGDEFEYEIKHGRHMVTKHSQKLENINKNNIIGAYATILYKDGKEVSEVMTFEQIKQSWLQSPMKPVDDKGNIKPGTTHDKFTAEMAERTAISKVCKRVINSSSDKSITSQFAKKLDSEVAEAETEEILAENANMEELDFDDEGDDEIIEGESEVIYEEDEEVISDGDDGQLEMEPGY